MPIEFSSIACPEKVHKDGHTYRTVPAHISIRVHPPHTIWNLRQAAKKQRRRKIEKALNARRVTAYGKPVVPAAQPIGYFGRLASRVSKAFGFA